VLWRVPVKPGSLFSNNAMASLIVIGIDAQQYTEAVLNAKCHS
jgi:hypothetical protein